MGCRPFLESVLGNLGAPAFEIRVTFPLMRLYGHLSIKWPYNREPTDNLTHNG